MICVYHIINKETDEVLYVGSTKDYNKRKKDHRNLWYKEKYNHPIYKYIRENDIQYDMKPIKTFDTYNKEELLQEEQEEIEKHINLLNSHNAFGFNIEKNKELTKKYREENRDKLKELNKKWREDNKELLKEKRKKYIEENKYTVKETKKKYYEKNKEQKKEKITCECGSKVRKDGLTQHKKSKKHQTYLENKS